MRPEPIPRPSRPLRPPLGGDSDRSRGGADSPGAGPGPVQGQVDQPPHERVVQRRPAEQHPDEQRAAGGLDEQPGIGARCQLAPLDAAPDLRKAVRAATGGAGLAAAFDFAGVPPVREQAVSVLAPKGRLVLVRLTDKPLTVTDGTRFSYLQQRVLGHYGSDMPVALPQLLRLIQGGRLDFSASISGVLPLAEAAEAVARLETKEGAPVRLILRP